MLTMADVESRHERIKREMREIRRKLRTRENVEGLAERLDELSVECKALHMALKRHQEIAEFLFAVEPYGGAH